MRCNRVVVAFACAWLAYMITGLIYYLVKLSTEDWFTFGLATGLCFSIVVFMSLLIRAKQTIERWQSTDDELEWENVA
jgi:hypothetical protein